MSYRRRLVRVPASSANLGPGYDVLAAALDLGLELEVAEADELSVDPGDERLPADRSNLCVRAFESLHPAEGLRFTVRSSIPLARGLGSSAAAIVAGLVAADRMLELGLEPAQLYARAVELEGHPDNVGAALFGGFVACPVAERDGALRPPARLGVPEGLEAVLVVPDEEVATSRARAAMPATVALADAVANVAAVAQLVLGIERSDLDLIARGLDDRLHQPARRDLYRRSIELVEAAPGLGALGATISGAGPTVLVWCRRPDTGEVTGALAELAEGWARVMPAPFSPRGADVREL